MHFTEDDLQQARFLEHGELFASEIGWVGSARLKEVADRFRARAVVETCRKGRPTSYTVTLEALAQAIDEQIQHNSDEAKPFAEDVGF